MGERTGMQVRGGGEAKEARQILLGKQRVTFVRENERFTASRQRRRISTVPWSLQSGV